MSEEVLQALMHLFAIIANQDGGNTGRQGQFVVQFLQSQVGQQRVITFFQDYHRHLIQVKSSHDVKTSMSDSVKTLSICKKINKTLNQKQKLVVYIRLLEFIKQSGASSDNRNNLLKTVAEVFNIASSVTQDIDVFYSDDFQGMNRNFALVTSQVPEISSDIHILSTPEIQSNLTFLHISELNLILLKFAGSEYINLNGQDIHPSTIYLFPPGSSVRNSHNTIYYADISNVFLNVHFDQSIRFEARIDKHNHSNGKQALHPLKIQEHSGNLVAIMGASGSGKTTLLHVLAGLEKPTNGEIIINGLDLYESKKILKGIAGYIPQNDLLLEDLTVFQNLYLAAELCLKNISKTALKKKVLNTLESLGLTEIKDIRVGSYVNKKISGGQRKRLNIALELIRDSQILFVDEPTSGLSSKDSENVIDLLKELTNKGKLIFVVIHQPSSEIYKLFSKVILVDTGGYVIYQGDPIEAIKYFKGECHHVTSESASCSKCGTVNPELLFNLIEAHEVDEFGKYTPVRKVNPGQWHQKFIAKQTVSKESQAPGEYQDIPISPELPGRLKQLSTFIKRDILSKLANQQYLLINLLEVPVLAAVLALFIRNNADKNAHEAYTYLDNDNIPAYFFMSTVVALLVGLTVSAEEIFKDQRILKREAHIQLSRLSYLKSKVLLLFGLSAIQAFLYCLISQLILEIPSRFLTIYAMIFTVFCFANLLGLILSSSFNSVVTIYVIIPLIIIPQMILGGAMFKFSELNTFLGQKNESIPVIADWFVSRWAYEGLMTDMALNNDYEKELYQFNQLESEINYKNAYLFPTLKDILENKKRKLNEGDTLYANASFDQVLLEKTLKTETTFAQDHYGFPPQSVADTLSALKEFYSNKYITLLSKREEYINSKKLNEKELFECSTNRSINEIATQFTAKEKIVLDSTTKEFHQIIDPIYCLQPLNKKWSVSEKMFYPVKSLFYIKIDTYNFNITCIWVMNLLCFIGLYFDILKRLIHKVARFNIKFQQSHPY